MKKTTIEGYLAPRTQEDAGGRRAFLLKQWYKADWTEMDDDSHGDSWLCVGYNSVQVEMLSC